MNIRASYRYQMEDYKKSIMIFYFVMVLVFSFILTTIAISVHSQGELISKSSFSGVDISSAIFLFVAGLVSFKETLCMMNQNGISRRTMYIGRVLTTVSVAFIMAVFDKLLLLIFKGVASNISDNLEYTCMYDILYTGHAMEISTVRMHIESFFFNFFMYLTFIAVGYLISTIFYRLNKVGKVLLASGLPVGIFVIFPIIDSLITNGKMTTMMIKFLDTFLGLSKQMPIYEMISCTIAFILLSAISWLFIRTANIKE